jgi:hypothetical protein
MLLGNMAMAEDARRGRDNFLLIGRRWSSISPRETEGAKNHSCLIKRSAT